ncbi:MAG: hypothetical protein JXA52_05305 [Planctomycetes bacterium]|nr:hypothetical protein [Planctomycetota bacterium]
MASATKNPPKSMPVEARLTKVMQTLRKLHDKDMKERLSSAEELVCAIITEDGVELKDALAAIKRMRKAFVNWNEVRVSRLGEIARVLSPLENSEELAIQIRGVLGRIFEHTGGMHLGHLAEMKISEARRALNEIEPVRRHIADRILMAEVPGINMAFSTEAVKLARQLNLIPKSGNKQNLRKLVQLTMDASDSALFFYLLHLHLEKGCAKSKCPLCKKR